VWGQNLTLTPYIKKQKPNYYIRTLLSLEASCPRVVLLSINKINTGVARTAFQRRTNFKVQNHIKYIYILDIISSNGVLVVKLIFAFYEEINGPNVVFKISYNFTQIRIEKNRVQSFIVLITTTLLVPYSLTHCPKHLSMPTVSGYSRFIVSGHLLT